MLLEGYSPLEALYMAVISITTVGYGEVHPLSNSGRVFTLFLLLFGVGSLAFAAHSFTESMIERVSDPVREKKNMQKKIDRLQGHTIICGHGRVGAAAAVHLHDAGQEFVVLENSTEEIETLTEKGFFYLSGDATSEKTMIEAGIKRAGALMALLNSDPANLFTVLTARELNPTLHIVARSESAYAESKILRAGADSIISPYASAGRRVADKIMAQQRNKRAASLQYETVGPLSQTRWLEVTEESGLVNHSVAMAASFMDGQIVGLRRAGTDMLSPTPDTQLAVKDRLLVISVHNGKDAPKGHDQPQKIVLIDDNPVIRRLYTRLFQKAGFNIMTAASGREGEVLVLKEQPDAAVVDYMLGDITGLDVCRHVRESEAGQSVKLVLFTADETPEVHEKALQVGVDVVVVKSPDAAEVVNLVTEAVAVKEKSRKNGQLSE